MGWSLDPGPPKAGKLLAIFYGVYMNNDELSIFVDELGDFGKYDIKSPYYIIALVFHNQSIVISDEIDKFNNYLEEIGYKDIMIHTGPIIRQENIFRNMDLSIRRKILNRFIAFVKKLDIMYMPFIIDKKHVENVTDMSGRLSKEISGFIRNNNVYFSGWKSIKIYYDNGQVELSKILSSTFNIMLGEVTFKKVMPKDYKLFQVADLFCTVESLRLKIKHKRLTKSENIILGTEKEIYKNVIKKLDNKCFK